MEQTITTLGGPSIPAEAARRRFRIKAHFGLVVLTADGRFDAGQSEAFDAFLKNERELAPVPDEFFITDKLLEQLGVAEKQLFETYKEAQDYDSLRTALYRLKSIPSSHGRNILEKTELPKDFTDSEWRYLRTHVITQRQNVIARNHITIGLINSAREQKKFTKELLTKLSIRGINNFLHTAYPYNFNFTIWRPVKNGSLELEKVFQYPKPQVFTPRRVSLDRTEYQVVRAWKSCRPVVTQCVSAARISGEWVDFDDAQKAPARCLHGAIQFPIYFSKKEPGLVVRQILAVLSIDTDKPDLFLNDELDMWTDDLVGYLANLALAEHLPTEAETLTS